MEDPRSLPTPPPPPPDGREQAGASTEDSDLALSESETESEDATAWRANAAAEDSDDDGEGGALDGRVASAFESLNAAIATNNEVEAQHAAKQRELERFRQEGVEKLGLLEQQHRRHLAKLKNFSTAQKAAQQAAARLRRLSTEAAAAREVLQCADEALDLQREAAASMQHGCADVDERSFHEAEIALCDRRTDAERQVKQLAAERRRCASEAERRARKVIALSAELGDAAEAALPYLARQASLEFKERSLEASVRDGEEAAARAKGRVKEAMGDLERISLDIMAKKQEEEGNQ